MKILSLFTGIGAFEKALFNLQIPYDVVGYSEIDKYASKAYSLIHNEPETKNLGDITKIDADTLLDFDLMTWGFPCQDISVAGRQAGMEEGTRSGLYHEGLRILKAKLPKYSIIENVKNLTSKKFKKQFEGILQDIEELGYNNYYKVLNAKDYGVPQNRERVFIISIRKDVDDGLFLFPEGFDNGLRLKDLLEDNVDEKYYIQDWKTKKLLATLITQLKDTSGLLLNQHNIKVKEFANTLDANYFKGVYSNQGRTAVAVLTPDRVEKRQYSSDGCSPSLNTCGGGGQEPKILEDVYRIRKLTPKECWRLMGFQDTDIDKCIEAKISNSQLYKMAGNSIVVNVLQEIFKGLLERR